MLPNAAPAISGASEHTATTDRATETQHVPFQQKPFGCTYSFCQLRFNTEKEMRLHKKYGTETGHFFCNKCDVDCEDWEDLIRHKVDRMAPWVEGKLDKNVNGMPKHVVCEFCGIDFKSFGGRKRHRKQEHPAEQEVKCPACLTVHSKASHMVAHLEKGRCQFISRRTFLNSMQQKYVNTQIMTNPEKFQENMNANLRPPPPVRDQITAESVTQESEVTDQDEGGGVSILDQQDEEIGGHKPLLPEVNLMDQGVPLTRANLEQWPRLPGMTSSQLSQSKSGMSINGSAITADDTDSQATTTATTRAIMEPAPWPARNNTSRQLFPQAKPTPSVSDWNAIGAQLDQAAERDDRGNLLKVAWWNPQTSGYDAEVFYRPEFDRYCCPFPGCGAEINYETAEDFHAHIELAHLRRIFNCPSCLKRFKSCAALVGHAESTFTCPIKESKHFNKLIDDISGGFVKAKYIGEKKIYRPETAVVKAGQPTGGVMSTQFIGKRPEES